MFILPSAASSSFFCVRKSGVDRGSQTRSHRPCAENETRSVSRAAKLVSWVAVFILGLANCGLFAHAQNQSSDAPAVGEKQKDDKQNDADLTKTFERLRQPGDDESVPLEPIRARTPQEQKRLDAMAHFMVGQLQESRLDPAGAYKSYKKAVELDPDSIDIYRALLPLAFRLSKPQDLLTYGQKAVELDPDDYKTLQILGSLMAGQRKLSEALELLEKAIRSKSLDKKSVDYVKLMRALGTIYDAAGKTQKAADAYEVLLDALIDPAKYNLDFRTHAALVSDPASGYEALGEAFLKAKRPERAIAAFEAAVKARKGNPSQLSYSLARVYSQSQRYEEALEQLQHYFDAQLQSKGRDAYVLLATILKAIDRSDELVERLEILAEDDPRNAALQAYLADQYIAADRLDDAQTLLQRIADSSGDAQAYLGLAAVHRRTGNVEKLLHALGKSLKAARRREQLLKTLATLESEVASITDDQELVDKLISLGRTRSEGDEPELDFSESLVLATLAAQSTKTDDAIHFYRFALEHRRQLAGVILDDLGSHLLEVDRLDEAVKTFEEAATDPALRDQQPHFLTRLAQAREFSGDTEGALETIREALKAVPDQPALSGVRAYLRFQEAWIYLHSRRWEPAADVLQQVIAKYPQHRAIVRKCQFSLSNLYVQQGDFEKGTAILEKVFEENPDDPSVNNDLGYLYAEQGKNLEKAEGMIRKALAAEPENAAYLDSMGWVLYKLERYDEALENLKKAADNLDDTDATIIDHLGDSYHKLGRKAEAVDAWTKALKKAQEQTHPDQKVIDAIKKKLSENK